MISRTTVVVIAVRMVPCVGVGYIYILFFVLLSPDVICRVNNKLLLLMYNCSITGRESKPVITSQALPAHRMQAYL